MYSRARIAGHPVHPILVTLPIGGLVFSFLAIIGWAVQPDQPFWLYAGYWLTVGGLLFGVLAAAAGLVDWFNLPRDTRAAGIATWHMLLNVGVMVAFFAVWVVLGGIGGPTQAIDIALPLVLQVVGLVVLSVSGWLGGELVYRHHVAVEPLNEVEEQTVDRYEHGQPLPGSQRA